MELASLDSSDDLSDDPSPDEHAAKRNVKTNIRRRTENGFLIQPLLGSFWY